MQTDPTIKFLTKHLASLRNFNPVLVGVIILLTILRRQQIAEQTVMEDTTQDRIAALPAQLTPVLVSDTMSEAARKALLKDFIRMLANQGGSQTSDGVMPVHDMRVATRRMRSVFQLLGGYFKPKSIRTFQTDLRSIARALGTVRDLDVLMENLSRFGETLEPDNRAPLDRPLALLRERRDAECRKLVKVLGRKRYRQFVETFTTFATTAGAGAQSMPKGDAVPTEVRHLLPPLAYERLAAVRAYDRIIDSADETTLHMLRIEFKRLRYLLAIFEDVTGKAGKEFINEIKVVQDHLGGLQDAVVAQSQLQALLPELSDDERAALERYVATLAAEQAVLRAAFPDVWKRFNSRAVLRQLGSALSGL